jgi:hypothetical protein
LEEFVAVKIYVARQAMLDAENDKEDDEAGGAEQ